MKKYELVVVFNANKNKEEIDALTSFVEKTITVSGGTNLVKDVWGEKELAYLINKQNKGYYILFTFESTGENNLDIEAKFNMNIDVIRYLIIKDEKEKIMKKLEVRAARKAVRLAARAEKERAFRENNEGSDDRRRNYDRNSGNNRYNKNRSSSPSTFTPPIATAKTVSSDNSTSSEKKEEEGKK